MEYGKSKKMTGLLIEPHYPDFYNYKFNHSTIEDIVFGVLQKNGLNNA